MEQTDKHGMGPALAIIVIVGIVAIAGIYFYKNIVRDYVYENGSTVTVPRDQFDQNVTDNIDLLDDLSESTDIEDIASDLEQELENDIDLSFIDEIDADLLDFDDLDDLDLEL